MARRGRAAWLHDFDLTLAADFRCTGEPAETLASHIALLAPLGVSIGLLWLRDPQVAPGATVHPRIAALVRRGAALPIDPSTSALSCALLIVHRPDLVPNGLGAELRLHAERTAILLATPLSDPAAQHLDTAAVTTALAACSRRPPVWCPTSPAIRASCQAHEPGLVLHEEDVGPVEPLAPWRTARPERPRPVAGRILGTAEALPPAGLAGYLDDPGIELRFLGGTAAPAKPMPPGWSWSPLGAVGTQRFLARLDFYLSYAEGPPRAFPRTALQAMAAGRLLVAPPTLKPVLGPGPVYRAPEHVAETLKYLHAEPRFYTRYRAEQDAALAERFGPGPLLRLVGLRPSRSAARRAEPARRTVVFYPTNGVGLGHVTRLLAVARRLPSSLEPVFLTPCHALAVIEHAGYRTEYVAEAAQDETDPQDQARAMTPRLLAALRHYDPAGIVFDGNVPREALLAACAQVDAPTIWVRRGMWRADPALDRHPALSRFFDAVIEPGEAAAAMDSGATARARDGAITVPPVMLLDRRDLLPPAAARAALELAGDRPTALVQLGSGHNNDIDGHLDRLVEAAASLGVQLVVAEWLIRQNPYRRRGLRTLAAFPNARYLRAFDLAVSAAGYNSFHELLHLGVPTLFLPNDHQQVDDQRARAAWAETAGAAVCVPRGAEHALKGYLTALLEPDFRRQLARRARAACAVNGAAMAAAAVEQVIARG